MAGQIDGEIPQFDDDGEKDEKRKFELPKFGKSPGPTPLQTPTASRPETPTEAEPEVCIYTKI